MVLTLICACFFVLCLCDGVTSDVYIKFDLFSRVARLDCISKFLFIKRVIRLSIVYQNFAVCVCSSFIIQYIRIMSLIPLSEVSFYLT